MIRIFKTNIQNLQKANEIIYILSDEYPGRKINFDLEDCDNILRIEGTNFQANTIIQLLEKLNHICVELD